MIFWAALCQKVSKNMSDSKSLFPVIGTETQKLLAHYGSFAKDDLDAMLNSSIEVVKNFPHPINNNNFKKQV